MFGCCCEKRSNSTESINEDIQGDHFYQNYKLDNVQEGLWFFITGKILRNGDRFIINFCLDNPDKDIALRVACRVSTNSVTRNCRIENVWGLEETDIAVPFRLKRDSRFKIQILFTNASIRIAFNNRHTAKFIHRLPFHDIRSIEIRGDVEDVYLDSKIVIDYPIYFAESSQVARLGQYDGEDLEEPSSESDMESMACPEAADSLPLPFYASYEKCLFDKGYRISFEGHIRLFPHLIKVSLQIGRNVWPQPPTALLMEFRFIKSSDWGTGEPDIVCNSFAHGKWSGEVKSELATGLQSGFNFHLVIERGKKSFKIDMNNKQVIDYPYKANPKYVDTIFVVGDIKLHKLKTEILEINY